MSPEATAESDAGLEAFERGDLVAAERHLRRADEVGGRWGAFRLGFLLEGLGRTADAEAAYRRAVDRGSASAAVNLGVMLERREDRAGAIEAYTTAVRLGDVGSMRRLAALGQIVRSDAGGVVVGPGTTWSLTVSMAQDGYAAGQLTAERYEQILLDVIDNSRDPVAGHTAAAALGGLAESGGDLERAEQLYRRVCDEAEPDTPLHAATALALGNLMWTRRDKREAESWWRRAMASRDADAAPEAALALGSVLLQQDRLDEADESLRLAIGPGAPDVRVGVLDRLGDMLVRRGDFAAARVAYEHLAASQHPQFAPRARACVASLDGLLSLASDRPASTAGVKRRWWRRSRNAKD